MDKWKEDGDFEFLWTMRKITIVLLILVIAVCMGLFVYSNFK